MQKKPALEEKFPVIPLVLICLLALWLRIPGINAGMPYFYAEDEAHHFNRTVEMVKEGRYDPQYFHKPSLHFYLRMPVVALSYLWSVKKGYINSVKEIETRNSFGLAGYAFTASHPGIVKWNRAFSVALSILTVLFTFLLCRQVTGRNAPSLVAALLLAVSPEFLINSPIIGVDILMALMCVVSSFAALVIYKNYSLTGLVVLGLLCGLAVSSKYNALPIAVLPLAVCIGLRKLHVRDLAIAALSPAAGFFLGSPFILISIPLFLDQLSYEIWHYGVAGHVGHSAQPGFEQAAFYAKWLVTDGMGWSACIIALAGLALLRSDRKKEAALFLVFPALFAALMIGQKANFTRNMVSLLPYVAILAAAGLDLLLRRLKIREDVRASFFWLCLPILCLQPLIRSLTHVRGIRSQPESRTEAQEWIRSDAAPRGDMAISGELQFPTAVYRLPAKSRIDTSKPLGLNLYQSGFDSLIAGPEFAPSAEERDLLLPLRKFEGVNEAQRVIMNPTIEAYEVRVDRAVATLEEKYRSNQLAEFLSITPDTASVGISCSDRDGKSSMSPGEHYCWLQNRFTALKFNLVATLPKSLNSKLTLTLMTPWPEQTLQVQAQGWKQTVDLSALKPGEWAAISIVVPSEALRGNEGILFRISQVHSPISQKVSNDTRRLGLAIKEVLVEAIK